MALEVTKAQVSSAYDILRQDQKNAGSIPIKERPMFAAKVLQEEKNYQQLLTKYNAEQASAKQNTEQAPAKQNKINHKA